MRTAALLLVLVAASPAFAETFASIHGRVVAEDHLPLPDAEVTISGGGLARPLKTTANAFGQFVFIAVPRGDGYVLSVSVPGFFPARLGSVGSIAAGERLYAETTLRLSNPNLCEVTWWRVTRRDPTDRYVWPLPDPQQRWFCL